MLSQTPMDEHHDAVASHHRFQSKTIAGELWEFGHLDAFAFKTTIETSPGQQTELTVVVLFSNHCFTRSQRAEEQVDPEMVWLDDREVRVLDRQRYELSRQLLPKLIWELSNRHIQVADASRPNFVTFEIPSETPRTSPARYAVFFEVEKDKQRRRRVLLRVQSAYLLEEPSKRQLKADKMRLHTLLKKAYAK